MCSVREVVSITLFPFIILSYLCVLPVYLHHVPTMHMPGESREDIGICGTFRYVRRAMDCPMGAGSETQVHWKHTQCS